MSKQNRTIYEKKYLGAVSIWETWLTEAKADSDSKAVEECGQIIDELKGKNTGLLQALDAYDAQGLGVTFVSGSKDSWAMIILDATENTATAQTSSFRYQLFDRRGFVGHGVYPSPYAAIAEVFDMGYAQTCVSPLDELARTEEWKQGMVVAEAAQNSWRTAAGGN